MVINNPTRRTADQECFPISRQGASHPAQLGPLDIFQSSYLAGDKVPAVYDGIVSATGPRFSYGVNHTDASLLPDSFEQPDIILPHNGIDLLMTCSATADDDMRYFSHDKTYPNDTTYPQQHPDYNWAPSFDPMDHDHVDSAFVNTSFIKNDTRHTHYKPQMAPAVPGHRSQGEPNYYWSTQDPGTLSAPQQATPSFHWESDMKPPFVTPIPTTVGMDGSSGRPRIPSFQALTNPDHSSELLFNTVLPFPANDPMEQYPHLDSQLRIHPSLKSDSQQSSIRDLRSGHGGPRFVPTNTTHESDQENRAGSYGRPAFTCTSSQPLPGPSTSVMRIHDPSNGIHVDRLWRPQLESPAPIEDHIIGRQATPAGTHTAYEGNVLIPSLSSSDDWNSCPFPPTASRGCSVNPTLDGPWAVQFSEQSQPADHSLPIQTPNLEPDTPRHQETRHFSSSYSGEASPSSLYTTNEDHPIVSSSCFIDEELNISSLAPDAHSWNTSNAREHLEKALGWSSPLTNAALIKLFILIMESPFIKAHEMEPNIDSYDGQALLKQVQGYPDCPLNLLQLSNGSILTLFADYPEFRCLICGKPKQSMARVVGCLRSHLNHRPYACHGEGGCETCPKDRVVRRFFTASLLYDHCTAKKVQCISCGTVLKSSMKRHWDSKHRGVPFPYDRYPGYYKE